MTRDDTALQLSVLMPVRDGSKYLHSSILTTLIAMPSSSELLVIDDGSCDNSVEIALDFDDPRVKVVLNPGPHGLSNALNLGLSLARGKYVARMDSDDICLPWRFTVQLRALNRSDVDFVFATAVAFGRPLKPYWLLPQLPLRLTDSQFKLGLCRFNPAVHPTMAARRNVLKSLGGYRHFPAEDLDLWLRAALAGCRFSRLAIPCVGLRLHERQLSRSQAWLGAVGEQFELNALREQLWRDPSVRNLKPRPLLKYLLNLESSGLPRFAAPWKRRKKR